MIKVEVMNKADKSQKAETAFKLFDKNRDGYITREEFTKVFTFFVMSTSMREKNHLQVSKRLTPEQIEAVFAKFDNNGDGRLSMDEFRLMMSKSTK